MKRLLLFLVFLFFTGFYIFFQSQSIFGGDGGDLVSAICTGGIPHPPGYPLYTLVGRLLFNGIKIFTPAWRVSLLSSIPAAGTLIIIFLIIFKFTKSVLSGLVGVSALAFSYLFWLYASVPEVFSLNNFFFVLLLYLTILLLENISDKRVYAWFLIAGLSASHHHFSLWFYPVLGLFVYFYNRKYWHKKIWLKIIKCFFFFSLGLIPYLYVPLAARTYPLVSWDNAVNLENFFHLITRQGYGSFVSTPGALQTGFMSRFPLLINGITLIPHFFGEPWTLFIIAGFIYLFKNQKKSFYLFSALLAAELLFLFYTGFPLRENDLFTQGTYSRFLMPEIIMSGILLGVGVFWISKRLISISKLKVLKLLIMISFFIIPLSLFARNMPKIYALRSDFTAENLGRDLLSTVPPGGILVLTGDTPAFNSEYVNFCLKEYSSIRPLLISIPPEAFKKIFPDLNVLFKSKSQGDFLREFVQLQASGSALFSNDVNVFSGGNFVPEGLLFRYYSDNKMPSLDEVEIKNKKIWSGYHDPRTGILKWFYPTTLADVLTIYNGGALQVGAYFFDEKKYDKAEEYLKKALDYNPDDIDAGTLLAIAYSHGKKCSDAENLLLRLSVKNPLLPDSYFHLAENAKNCFRDPARETKFRKIYEEKLTAGGGSLKELAK